MKFWQVVSWCETEHLVEVAKHSEALGFEGVILAEHIFYPAKTDSHYYYSTDGKSIQHNQMEFPDPLISFAAMAAVTTKLKMMTGIYILPLRHPIDAAKNMATLARISQDRFLLGTGAGWLEEEFKEFGIDFKTRGKRLDEMLEIQKQLWTGKSISYKGDHFDFSDVQIRPYPEKPIPVIAGGYSKAALKRAIQCDGWYGPGNTLEDLKGITQTLLDGVKASKKDSTNYRIIAPLLSPLDEETIQKMEAMGVTDTVNYPFLYGIGEAASIEQKKAYMTEFAERFIHPL